MAGKKPRSRYPRPRVPVFRLIIIRKRLKTPSKHLYRISEICVFAAFFTPSARGDAKRDVKNREHAEIKSAVGATLNREHPGRCLLEQSLPRYSPSAD